MEGFLFGAACADNPKSFAKKTFAVLPHHSILKFIFPIRQVHY
mgnify:CR=1 FL=1